MIEIQTPGYQNCLSKINSKLAEILIIQYFTSNLAKPRMYVMGDGNSVAAANFFLFYIGRIITSGHSQN